MLRLALMYAHASKHVLQVDQRWPAHRKAGRARGCSLEVDSCAMHPYVVILGSACVHPEGSVVVTASGDRTVRMWAGTECMHVLRKHEDAVRGLVFKCLAVSSLLLIHLQATLSADSFVSVSNDTTCVLWSFSGQPLRQLYGHEVHILIFAFVLVVMSREELCILCCGHLFIRVCHVQ